MGVGADRRCAVLGSPIAHSLSPRLHRAAYVHLGLDWTYDAIEVTEDELGAFVAGLDGSWRGLSLTMPLKAVGAALATRRSALVERLGVANTLLLEGDDRVAANTDVPGMRAALGEAGACAGPHATVLGAGSTALAALAALSTMADEVTVVARTPSRTQQVVRVADTLGVAVTVLAWEDARQALAAPIVLSTVPTGAADPLAAFLPRRPGLLFDVVYDPWPTPLATAWARAGGHVCSGLDLLVWQAVEQVRLMTERSVPVQVLRTAVADR
jgi:shikimate dehydrogenase